MLLISVSPNLGPYLSSSDFIPLNVTLSQVSISPPAWDAISFMDVGDFHFGVFGYTGSTARLCYYLPISILWFSDDVMYTATCAFILYPIAAGIAGISVLLGLRWASYQCAGTALINLIIAVALLCTLVAWVISTILFGIQCTKLSDNGTDATLGNATWLGFGALVFLFLGFCNTAYSVCGSSRRTRRG